MSSERQEHTENSPWWGEHIHRYKEALKYIRPGARILDIACGTGFGSFMLAKQGGANVFGGDISEEAISYCKNTYVSEPLLTFQLMDGTHLPFDTEFFDAVVSFETIEHTREFDKMLSEFSRVLKPGAIAIISTPNIVVNSPGGVVLNPFHTQEFTYSELESILQRHFRDVEIGGQEYARYNKTSFANRVGKRTEQLLYLRGIRKIPLSAQNALMRMIIGKDVYPSASDFEIVHTKERVLECKTFFAICKKGL